MNNQTIIKIILGCVESMDKMYPRKHQYRVGIQQGTNYSHYNWDEPPVLKANPFRFEVIIECRINGEWQRIFIYEHSIATPEKWDQVIGVITAELFTYGVWQCTENAIKRNRSKATLN